MELKDVVVGKDYRLNKITSLSGGTRKVVAREICRVVAVEPIDYEGYHTVKIDGVSLPGLLWISHEDIDEIESVSTKFTVEQKCIYTGNEFMYVPNKICTIADIDSANPVGVLYKIRFDGPYGHMNRWVIENELRAMDDSDSPTVGETVVFRNGFSFRAENRALSTAYAELKQNPMPMYIYSVTVAFHCNVTFVTVTVDTQTPVTQANYPLRLFAGKAICNGKDTYDPLVGLRVALRDAMDIGEVARYRDSSHRRLIQKETWHFLRIALKDVAIKSMELFHVKLNPNYEKDYGDGPF
jgi:hypothetical protein